MKKRITASVLLTAFMMMIMIPCALANSPSLKRVPTSRWLPRYVDDEEMVTTDQAEVILAKLDEISKRQKFDVNIVVVHELDDRGVMDYAGDFYEDNDYGFGSDNNGILLLLAMKDRDYGLVAYGYGMYAFTSTGHEYLADIFLPYLADDEYYEAFMAFAEAVDDFVAMAKTGNPYDEDNVPDMLSEGRRISESAQRASSG